MLFENSNKLTKDAEKEEELKNQLVDGFMTSCDVSELSNV